MVRKSDGNGRRRKPGPRGPAYDEGALIVRVAKSPDTIRHAAESFALGERSEDSGLDWLRGYVERTPGAALRYVPSRGERFTDTAAGIEEARWELGVLPAPAGAPPAPAIFHLRLGSPADLAEVQAALRQDEGLTAHQPAILSTPPEPRRFRGVHRDHQWALARCRFREVWDDLDTGEHPTPLAVIDSGRHTGHPDLEGCITGHVPPLDQPQSTSVHASSVAGVLAAIRGNRDDEGMAGCCSARVHLFNVWGETFDYMAFYRALESVLQSDIRVVNLSLTSPQLDETVEEMIQQCAAAEKVMVAAMGDFGPDGPPMFPAASTSVIAVGGTTRHDRRFASSSRGTHIWLSAPAKGVWTIFGDEDYEPQDGTSYATAMVSAAAWLALRNRPELTLAQVRELLSRSVALRKGGKDTTFQDIGHGRLDMVELRNALPTV
jgi:hypothetical protein